MSTIERACAAYDLWWPTATQAFDLILTYDLQGYVVERIYDRGVLKSVPHAVEGWVEWHESPMDITNKSAHVRLTFASLKTAFDDGLQAWLEQVRVLSQDLDARLQIRFRFLRDYGNVMTCFEVTVDGHDDGVEECSFLYVLPSVASQAAWLKRQNTPMERDTHVGC